MTTDTTLEPGVPFTSVLYGSQDRDWFAVNLEPGLGYFARVTINTGTDGGEGASFALLDETGTWEYSRWWEFGTPSSFGGAFGVETPGKYFISFSASLWGEIPYEVVFDTNDETPIGTPDTEGTAVLGETVSGRVDFWNDADWYSVSLTGGEEYTLSFLQVVDPMYFGDYQ
ncbi:hypothetical protein, partial [Aestuariicoccus sp. MJ-SS9]|uniref:hypothetical protein n=1 Tax=Aestuariicoccus sp. MJ-SS9 TaxID=3079855 RepID=UPI00290F457F